MPINGNARATARVVSLELIHSMEKLRETEELAKLPSRVLSRNCAGRKYIYIYIKGRKKKKEKGRKFVPRHCR